MFNDERDEAADWGTWLDRFERIIWPTFQSRGYSRDTAALIYFNSYTGVKDEDDE